MNATLLPVLFFLLQGGVAPIEPRPDPCDKAPLRTLPPTEDEWRLIIFDSERIRVRETNSWERIRIEHPVWTPEGIAGPPPDAWRAGRRVRSDTLAVSWTAIEEIEKQTGSHAGLGMGIAGLSALFATFLVAEVASGEGNSGLGILYIAAVAAPVAVAAGGLLGREVPSWTTIYCASPEPEPRSGTASGTVNGPDG